MGLFTHDITKCKKNKVATDKNGPKTVRVNKALEFWLRYFRFIFFCQKLYEPWSRKYGVKKIYPINLPKLDG